MRFWHLSSDSPLNLTFSADFRTSQPDYTNDHTWELCIGKETPRALVLRTTYGLRAGGMQIFPRFTFPQGERMDPSLFPVGPYVSQFLPNYVQVKFQPIPGLEVDFSYWLADSNLVIGHFIFDNTSSQDLDFLFEWVCLLKPLGDGQSMASKTYGINHVLQGRTSDLHPVCLMTGGAQPGAGLYPALTLQVDLLPGQKRQIQWALASSINPQNSFEKARLATARRWDAEIARLQMVHERSVIDIQTGDPDWDVCFAQAQSTAYRLLFPSSAHLPNPSFVLCRQPDHGNSLRKDGNDYPYLWSGQTALDTCFLSSLLLPGGVEWAKGLLDNFLSIQDETGSIDWKPGLAGQRSGMLAQPVLAHLAWEIFQNEPDLTWLRRIYPQLLHFVRVWFLPENDHDQDGFPEWHQPIQSGLPDSPLYDSWHEKADHCDIDQLESPALAAMLKHECECLLRIADQIKDDQSVEWLTSRIETLRAHLTSVWDAQANTYRYRDAVSHLSQKGVEVRRFAGDRNVAYKRVFKQPTRLQINLILENADTRPLQIVIEGSNAGGPVTETFKPGQFTWLGRQATATSQTLFNTLSRVRIEGLGKQEEMVLSTVNHYREDLSLLLPLWAGVPTSAQAEKIIRKNLLPRYLDNFGLALTPCDGLPGESWYQCVVPVIWNDLLLRGLLRYGYQKEAVSIFTHLMRGFVTQLKQINAFSTTFHAETGQPSGDKNALPGLPPVGLFLKLCGLRKISAQEVIFEGDHIFPWPVALKYKGMTITRHAQDTVIHFPSGQSVTVEGPGPHHVKLMVEPSGKEN